MDINDLRAMALKKQRATGKKISRNRAKGVELGGTKYDPRRDTEKVKKYNRRQLNSYIKQLDSFVSRETQFVGDREERPIPAKVWKDYKALEAKRNLKVQQDNDKVADLFLPTSGMTVKMRHELMDPTRTQAGNPTVNPEWKELDRKSSSIVSEKGLKKLSETLKKTLRKSHNKKEVDIGRDTIRKMAQDLGAVDLQDAVNKLSNQQFWVLWKHTKFANDLVLPYHVAKAEFTDDEAEASKNETVDINLKKAMRHVEWAKTVKLGGGL